MKITEMSDKELIADAKGYHQSIFGYKCFGINDIRWYDAILGELQRRGYSSIESVAFIKEE